MPKQPVQVQAASADAGEPMLQGQPADPELLGHRGGTLALPQPRHRVHHDFDAGHLAGKGVARQDPLPPVAALADRQRDGAHRECWDCVELARYAGPSQARTWRRAAGAPAGEKLLLDHFGIREERLVMARMHIEYVAHVLEGGPGVWLDFVRGRRFSWPHTIRQQVPPRRAQGVGSAPRADALTVARPSAQDAILRKRGSRQSVHHSDRPFLCLPIWRRNRW